MVRLHLVTYCRWSQHCGHPGTPNYAQTVDYANAYEIGQEIQYSCQQDFQLFKRNWEKLNVTERQCLPSGTWSNEHVLCYSDSLSFCCAHNGFHTYGLDRVHVLHSGCYSGYYQNYNGQETFRKNLTTTSPLSLVEVELQDSVELNMDLIGLNCTNPRWISLPPSSSSNDNKYHLFVIDRTTAVNSTCVPTAVNLYAKRWFRVCYLTAYETPTSCGVPETPANGELKSPQNETVAVFSCNKGYKRQGSKYRYCRQGIWTGTQPVCEQDSTGASPQIEASSETLSRVALAISAVTLLILLTSIAFKYIRNQRRNTMTAGCTSILFTKKSQRDNATSRIASQRIYDDCAGRPTLATSDEEEGIYANGNSLVEAPLYAIPVKKNKTVNVNLEQ